MHLSGTHSFYLVGILYNNSVRQHDERLAGHVARIINVINIYSNLVGKAEGKKVFVGLGGMDR